MSRLLVRNFIVSVAGLLSACANPAYRDATLDTVVVADFVTTFGDSSKVAVFVLDRVENQRSDAVVMFDHKCAGARIQHVVRDTITLLSNGHALRAFTLDYVRDGHVWSSSHMSFSGRWSKNVRGDVQYYSAAPSVVLNLTSNEGPATPMEMWLRLGDGVLTSMAAMGGSCPGSANDARDREMTYSRK
jgi:hypothetical protein